MLNKSQDVFASAFSLQKPKTAPKKDRIKNPKKASFLNNVKTKLNEEKIII